MPRRNPGTCPADDQHMSRFRTIDRKTAYLLPPSVDDWLPDDHLARFILEAIERLDLGALTRAYQAKLDQRAAATKLIGKQPGGRPPKAAGGRARPHSGR